MNKTNHIVAWSIWAVFYGLYSYFVAVRSSFLWADYFGFLAIHIGSFYLSVCWAFPWANPQWNRFNWRTALKLAGVVLSIAVAIPLLLTLVSMATSKLTVKLDPASETRLNIQNFLDVVVFLYSGLVFALFYLKFDRVERERDELLEVVEQLRVRLNEAEQANLEQSMIPHLYSNLLGTVNDVVRAKPSLAEYYMNIFNQIVRFYARLNPGELVSMAHEVEISHLFLELMAAKLGYPPMVELEVADAAHDVMVLPMQTMLLVENIDKYGVVDKSDSKAGIYIGLHHRHLIMVMDNEVKQQVAPPPLSTKKGLRSIRERLDAREVTYTSHHTLKNGRFSFVLIVYID
ncbi:hypothetical protein [Parapedobacter soli]|uniref:hypothetical protein n=1 Tax=Parapedobacter soli TaxID=416955 RepID=UPI0021CA2171|nr:hypothetical protein [Parapedobacter soli]